MSYRPKPLPVQHIVLESALRELVEDLAQNTHELWSRARLQEGWKFGPKRDDTRKETPCLVPYDELPDSEKEFDRITSQGAVRFILAKGFIIQAPKVKDVQAIQDAKRRALEFLNRGECIKAHDLILQCQQLAPDDRELIRMRATSLSRLGMAKSALRFFHTLLEFDSSDREVWGMIGRCYRTLYEQEADPQKKVELLRQSLHGHEKAHQFGPGPWTLINRATVHALLGESQKAQVLVEEILALTIDIVPAEDRDWIDATCGVACMLKGDISETKKYLQRHVQQMRPLWGMIASTRRNILLLSPLIGRSFSETEFHQVLDLLKVPSIKCIFPTSKFSPDMIQEGDVGVCVPYPHVCSEFAQHILHREGQLYLVLPCRADSFKLMMAQEHPQEYQAWEGIFNQLLARAKEVIAVGDDFHILDHSIRDYLERVAFGLSVLKSMEISSTVEILGHPSMGGNYQRSKIMALVFGDAVNFSKLQHEHFPIFEQEVWGLVHEILKEMHITPALANTWGDGLYMVLDDLAQAARFSLELASRMATTDWKAKGLPKDIGLRVGIHAGPVFESINPLTKNVSYIGASVCRAARIEPITPPGQVFVSQEFAALLASEHANKFIFSYVGTLSMAKNYGTFPMYRLEEAKGLHD
ncbi:MAG: hypothetical protein HYV97_01460 [Bdellovibrio sp.]|nr:hypothetical protein [Bdellovibrio sp.]